MPRKATKYAYCYASGQIEFGPRVPFHDGALPICPIRSEKDMNTISALARHAYDNATLLVPGVPEAPNQKVAMDALFRFLDLLKSQGLQVGD